MTFLTQEIPNTYSSSRGTYTPTRSSNPCPICNDITGKCRIVSEDFVLCMTHPTNAEVLGWRYRGETKGSYYGGRYEALRAESEAEQATRRETARLLAAAEEKAKQQRYAQLPAIAQRDRQWRNYLAKLNLNDIDRTNLYSRGLNDAQIEAIGFKSVIDGYITPIRNPQGLIIGAQLRRRETGNSERYRWHKPYGWDIHLPNGDVPIAFYLPFLYPETQGTPARVILVEGTGVKPALAANLLGIPAIGAAGGIFTASKLLLQEYLSQISAIPGTTKILIAPDAGDIANPAVLKRLQKTIALVRSLSYEIDILWWGQFSKQECDIDEIDDVTAIARISTHEFFKLGSQQQQWKIKLPALMAKLSPKPKPSQGFAPRQKSEANVIEYQQGQRLDTWAGAAKQGYKYILDLSFTGSRKTFDAGRVAPESFEANKAIYISDQHRNVTTTTLSSWVDLEARHSGLTLDDTGKIRRAKFGDRIVESANCGRADVMAALRAKGIGSNDSDVVCQTCPMLNGCQHSEGDGYGFKYARRETLAQSRLRSHPASLPNRSEFGYDKTVLIWDEADANFSTSKKLDVLVGDVDATIVRLSTQSPELFQQLQPLLTELRALLVGEQHKFGYDLRSLRQALPLVSIDLDTLKVALQPDLSCLDTIDEIDQAEFRDLSGSKKRHLASLSHQLKRSTALTSHEAQVQVEQQVLKQWLPEFLDILANDNCGYAAMLRRKLKLTLPDLRLRAIAHDSKVNIFLSATWSKEEAALVLGCQPDQIFVCRQMEAIDAVIPQIMQVSDLGRMGMQRGDDQTRRLEALISHYKQLDPSTQSIGFKKFNNDRAWWRDSRGLNDFTDVRTLIVVGTPCRNLLDLLAEYATLTGKVVSADDANFKAFVDRQILADIRQCFGRKMGARCQEGDLIVFVSDFELDFPAQQVKASDISIEAASKSERMEHGIKQAIAWLSDQGKKVTQQAIADCLGKTRSAISHYSELIFLLLETLYSKKIQNPKLKPQDKETCQALAQVVTRVVNSTDPIAAIFAAIHEIFFDWIPPRLRRCLLYFLDLPTQTQLLSYLALITGASLES
jgi:hypothetical protein